MYNFPMKIYDLKKRISDFFDYDNETKNKCCFLCFEKISGKSTEEHIFPQWFLDSWNLRKDSTTHVSGEDTRHSEYAKQKVKCCSECNNVFLSQVETMAKEYFINGKQMPESKIVIWFSKILLAYNFKAIKNRDWSMTIWEAELLSNLHILIYGFRFFNKYKKSPKGCVWMLREIPLNESPTWAIDHQFISYNTSSFLSIRIKDKFIWFVPFIAEDSFLETIKDSVEVVNPDLKDINLANNISLLAFIYSMQFNTILNLFEYENEGESFAYFDLSQERISDVFSDPKKLDAELEKFLDAIHNSKSSIAQRKEQ